MATQEFMKKRIQTCDACQTVTDTRRNAKYDMRNMCLFLTTVALGVDGLRPQFIKCKGKDVTCYCQARELL